MKNKMLKITGLLLFVAVISLQTAPISFAESAAETMEMDCCDKMEMMKKEMQPMMQKHKLTMDKMKSLFDELKQSGKLSQEQMNKMATMEQMMMQMDEMMQKMMKQMSSMEKEKLK